MDEPFCTNDRRAGDKKGTTASTRLRPSNTKVDLPSLVPLDSIAFDTSPEMNGRRSELAMTGPLLTRWSDATP
jgi:hypothetical protein